MACSKRRLMTAVNVPARDEKCKDAQILWAKQACYKRIRNDEYDLRNNRARYQENYNIEMGRCLIEYNNSNNSDSKDFSGITLPFILAGSMRKTVCIVSLSIFIARDGRVLRQIDYSSNEYDVHVIGYGPVPQKYLCMPNVNWHELPSEYLGLPQI